MSATSVKRRRRAVVQLPDHAEACEVRVLLSGIAIYPAQAEVSEAAPVSTPSQVSPLALSSSDYNGAWDLGGGILQLVVKGNNPEKGKVKGTLSAVFIDGGSAKFKGKISNGINLTGKSRAKLIAGPLTGKAKAELSVHLTDSTHFEGTGTTIVKGAPPMTGAVMGVKV